MATANQDDPAKRLFDVVMALLLLTASSPVWFCVFVYRSVKGLAVAESLPRVGLRGEVFQEQAFPVGHVVVRRLAALWNILTGEMSFVGPRPRSAEELEPESPEYATLLSVRPGLVCDWWLLDQVNAAYGQELEADLKYVANHTVGGDIGLLLRALPAFFGYVFSGGRVSTCPDEITIFDVRIDNLTMDEALARIGEYLEGDEPRQVCFMNPQYANAAYGSPEYREVLAAADLVLNDGIGMKIAGKILGTEFRQNVNGTDLFPRLCAALEGRAKGLYLLGAQPGVVEQVRDWIAARHPNLPVLGCHHGHIKPEEDEEISAAIAASGADLLLVGMGVPLQEFWIRRNLAETGVRVAMGVGGLFDFYSGRVERAPLWMRQIGMEWVYRIIQDPRRMWRRYIIGNNLFLYRVLKQWFRQDRGK